MKEIDDKKLIKAPVGGGGKWLLINVLACFTLVLLCVCIFYEVRTHEIRSNLAALGYINVEPSAYDDYNMLKGWSKSLEELNENTDIVFLGNSITYGSNFHSYFPSHKIVALGVPGQRIDQIERRIPTVIALKPRKLFIMAGINDLHRSSPETVGNRYESLLCKLRQELPEMQIYCQSILPVTEEKEDLYAENPVIDETNQIIKNVAEKNGCHFVDLNGLYKDSNGKLTKELTIDGVHLKPTAYSRWAEAIREYIEE